MKVAALLAATAAVVVSASPFNKRQLGGILLCTGANATGPCSHYVYPLGSCHDLPVPYLRNCSTFAPDGEDFYCYPRTTTCAGSKNCTSPTGCTFGAVDFNYTNKFDLGAIGWNTLIASFDCYPRN